MFWRRYRKMMTFYVAEILFVEWLCYVAFGLSLQPMAHEAPDVYDARCHFSVLGGRY